MSTLTLPRPTPIKLRSALIWPLAALGVIIGVYAALWFGTAHMLQSEAEVWIEEQRQDGMIVKYGEPRYKGFPGRVEVAFPQWSVTAPVTQNGWTWKADEIRVRTRPWSPSRFVLDLSGTHRIAGLWTATHRTAEVHLAEAEMVPTLDKDGNLLDVTTSIQNFRVTEGAKSPVLVAFDTGTFSLAGVPDAAAPTWRMHLEATNWRTPLTAQVPAFDPAIKSIRLTADLVGALEAGPLPTALEAWRSGGGTLQMRDVALNWPPLRITAEGTWALDNALQPQGAMTAKVRGFYAAVDALAEQGQMTREDAKSARKVLSLLSYKPEGSREAELKVAVTVQNSKLYFGPLELWSVPQVEWTNATTVSAADGL